MPNSELQPIGTIRGGRSKTPYKFFWNKATHHLYIERAGFFGSKKEQLSTMASSWEMAYHAAEAYAWSK